MRSPAELVAIGFQRSRVVIVNECHSGLKRCRRTRAVGRTLLPAAHVSGVRYLAMEALTPPFAAEANATRALPEAKQGYLAQDDMRALMSDALALAWSLVPYECEFRLMSGQSQEVFQSLEFANRRDDDQARRLAEFLACEPAGKKVLVWCGNSHQRKTPEPWGLGGTWVRLGQRLRDLAGLEPFVIDQSPTVEYSPGSAPRLSDVETFRSGLEALGGSGGFLREEDPSPRWRDDHSADAFILSVDNEMA